MIRCLHPPGQQHLAQAVVDLVGAGVQQVFPFEVDFGSAQLLAQAAGVVQGRGPAGIVMEEVFQFGLKFGRDARRAPSPLHVFERRHEGFWDEASAVRAKMAP